MSPIAHRVAARYKSKKVTENGNTVYVYSPHQVARRNSDKAKRLEKLRGSIDKIRTQVAKDLKSEEPDKVLTALAVGLMDETYERIGNDSSAKDGHFGVTGWKKKHIKFSQGKATISYVGKSGVKQKKTVSNKALVKALKDAYEACEDDCLFKYDGGTVDAGKVNAYLKPFGVSAKDIRGYHANDVMKAALTAHRKGKLPEDKKEREKKLKEEWKEALEATAAAVGHEPSTLRSQYLVPGLEDCYLKDGSIPKKMTKEADSTVLRVASRYKEAGFIPDSFWKGKETELKGVMGAKVPNPHEAYYSLELVASIYKRTFTDLEGYGLNRYAQDSLKWRVETILGQLEVLRNMYLSLHKEMDYHPSRDARGELRFGVTHALSSAFEKAYPTLGHAMKSVWVITPGSVDRLTDRLLKKATPEEIAALEKSSKDVWDDGRVKYAFYERVKLEAQAKKLAEKSKVDRNWLKWFQEMREMLAANYTSEGIGQAEGFDEFNIGNLKAVIVDPEVSIFETSPYVKRLLEARGMLQRKGLGKLWHGVLFIVSKNAKKLSEADKKAYADLGYKGLEQTAGTYHSGEDIVKITAPPYEDLVGTIVHEMGHRYWYKVMGPEQRARYNGLVQTNPSKNVRDYPSGPTDEAGKEKPVTPVSDYGASSIEEAFAEAFERYVMGGDMNRDQLESFRSVLEKTAGDERLDLAWVTKVRKDFLVLMKNLPLIKDYEDGAKVREGFKAFKNYFDKFVFENFLKKSLKYYQPRALSDSDKEYISKKLWKSGWDFYIEMGLPLGYPDDYYSKEERFARFLQDKKKWEARIRRKAQIFFKDLKEMIEWHDRRWDSENSEPGFVVKVPPKDREVLEGFKAFITGYDPDSDYDRDELERLKAGLRLYRKRAGQAFPLLLKTQLPLHVKFDADLDEGGRYETSHIMIAPSALPADHPNFVAHIMAHEMGHHVFKSVLSKDAAKFWSSAVRADYGPIDLGELLSKWPSTWSWASDFVKHMADSDPILALQVDVASHAHGSSKDLFTREEFQAAYDRGERTLSVPQTPITGYAGKNPEETFCEAVGRLVAFGPQAVLPLMRHWLEIILPGQIKTASMAERVALRHAHRQA